jgi:choline dehydrogenase-like flavoprotein
MIVDCAELPSDQELASDICVIGAGAAGITLALELLDSGLTVTLLEAGGLRDEADTQALYDGEVADDRLHSPPNKYRQRRFGGSTTIWGGRCMPFDPIDFELRDYIAGSGWPFTVEELAPWYARAAELCETGHGPFYASALFGQDLRPMIKGFRGARFETDTLEKFSCPTDFGARYGHRLRTAQKVRVVLHANVTALRLDPASGHITTVEATSLQRHRIRVRARYVVLATGGLETPRLLLGSNDVMPEGLGNAHGLVGRYYMCHLAGTIGELRFAGPRENVWHGYDVSDEGIYCRRRLALKPEVQRAERIGNFVARLHHPRISNPEHGNAILSALYLAKPLIPYEYAKRLHGEHQASSGELLRHALNVVLGPFDAVGFAWHMLRDRKLAERKFPSIIIHPKTSLYSLDFHAEQEPNRDSRITLADGVDELGLRRIRVDWRYTPGDVRTVQRALELLAHDLRESGVGLFDYDSADVEAEMTRYGAYGGHHIGTARMHRDPSQGVVDADGRVHDVDNLYVAGSAVFPTSSQANPTFTIVALAARLAAHLRVRVGGVE